MNGRRICTLMGSVPFLFVPAVAVAQPSQPTSVTGPTDPVAEEERGGLEEIVVTATRREERLQDIPVAVTAVGQADIAAAGIREVRQLTQIVPGLNGGRNLGVMLPTIRGVGSTGVSVGDEANVAIYIDGVYQGDPFSTQVDLVEIERVEVLRGPQGTVFGRNATGGLINVITPEPSFTARGRVSARYGRMRNDADDLDFRTYLTTPLSDRIAVDFAGLYRRNDGFIKNLTGGSALGKTEVGSLRSKLLIKPSDSATIIFTGAYTDVSDETSAHQPFKQNTLGRAYPGVILPTGAWQSSLDQRPVNDFKRFDLALRTRFELGSVNLETTSGYMHTNAEQYTDSDSSNIFLGFTDVRIRPRAFSQEVRLISDSSGPLKWLTGVYYFHLNGTEPIVVGARLSPAVPMSITVFDPKVKTRSLAGFVEGTYNFTDELALTLGGRYTTEKRKFEQNINGRNLFGTATKKFDRFDYRGAIRYEISPDANVYASYGTGFKSGVFSIFGGATPVEPETIRAIEGGIKADPLRWLRTNLAVYHYKYKDLQVTSRDANNAFILQNAATAEIYGGEVEATVVPIDDLNIRTSVAYNHSEYSSFPRAQVFYPRPTGGNITSEADVSGNQLLRAPEWTMNLGVNYRTDVARGSLMISGNIFHSARVYYDFLNALYQPSYELVSGEIGWTDPSERWTLSLFGTNLTNAKVAQQISPGPFATYVVYERPRRIGIGAAFRF